MKKLLLVTTAAVTCAATPAMAQELSADVDYENYIGTYVENSTSYNSDITIFGGALVAGLIVPDSSASSIADLKQVIDGNNVKVEWDPFLFVRPDEETLRNNASTSAITGNGNTGVNAAAGYNNAQANIGVISSATSPTIGLDPSPEEEDDDLGGMARANTTSWQSSTNNYYGPAFGAVLFDEWNDRNNASTGPINGSGNIGVNVAAGAFNAQANIMSLASVNNAALADASAGVLQLSTGNLNLLNDSSNRATVGRISAAGNVGVNVAAGNGNLQHNSLTVAASGANGS